MGNEVVTVVRPEDVEVAEDEERLRGNVLSLGHVLSVDFGGVFERLRIQLPRDSEVISAVAPEHGAAGTAKPHAAAQVIVEATRTNSEQSQLPLLPGKRVALAIRRFHVLPTPISSFRILSACRDRRSISSVAAAATCSNIISDLPPDIRAQMA
jgi:sulfate transport system ATP-binding protein